METFSNFGETTLAAALTIGATSLTVSDAENFPGSGNFRIKIDNELLLVTGVSGNTFTVTRAAESTTATSHISGSSVKHVLTAASLSNAVSEGSLTALTPSGSLPTASRALVSNGAGKITNSSVTSTELGYVSGVTSAIQTQLNAKAPNTQTMQQVVFEFSTDVTTGDGKGYMVITSPVSGLNLTGVHARVITAGTTGTTDIQIARNRGGSVVDMLSTKLTIDSTETGSDTGTPAVINTSNDDVQNYDVIRIDVDAVSTTAPKGLIVSLIFS